MLLELLDDGVHVQGKLALSSEQLLRGHAFPRRLELSLEGAELNVGEGGWGKRLPVVGLKGLVD